MARAVLALQILVWCGCGGQESGTPRMVAELAAVYDSAMASPMLYYYVNSRRAEVMREQSGQFSGQLAQIHRYRIARELLWAGETRQALDELRSLVREIGPIPLATAPRIKPLFDELALAYLRLGEQENCIDQHSPEACILPIIGGGLHTKQEGARQAILLYEDLLESFPGDFGSRWMLNVAYMTIGQYPDSVPEPFLVPGMAPEMDHTFPPFPNIAVDLGVAVNGLSGGLNVEDFDGDGHLDLFMTSYGLNDQARLFLADGQGGYVDHTVEAGLTGIVGGLNTAHADYDNDGDADVLVLRGAWLGDAGDIPNSLLRNRGDGTFEDVTHASGLLSYHPASSAAWADFNLDGWLDLIIGNESNAPWQDVLAQNRKGEGEEHRSELYLNNGDGTFTEVARQVGIDVSEFVKAVVWGDINNDGLPDLFVSAMGGQNSLYINKGGTSLDDWHFEDIAATAGVQTPIFSFPAWFWDYDNDGWDDLLVPSFDLRHFTVLHVDIAREHLGLPVDVERSRLFRNNGDSTFSDVTREAGLDIVLFSMGSNFGDLDNDGLLDFYIGTGAPDLRTIVPNRMFRQTEDHRFEEVTYPGRFAHIQKGHAVAFADLDRDGDQDVYAVMGGAYEGDPFPNALFDNPGAWPENAWVTLILEGRTANRPAVGARIEIIVETPDGGTRQVVRTVGTGGSFGAGSLQQEVGLGNARAIRLLQITWPNRERLTETYANLEVRRVYHIVEGEAPRLLERKPIPFARTSGSHMNSGHQH